MFVNSKSKMILSILCIIILIQGVLSITITETIHTLKSENVNNKFPGNPRLLNEGNNDISNNILSAPVLTIATAGIVSGVSKYSSSGDASSALNAVAKGITSSTAFYACQGGTSNIVSLVSPAVSIPAGYIAGLACAYGSNHFYDSMFGNPSSLSSNDVISNDVISNDDILSDILFSQSEIDFIIEALSDDNQKKSVKFSDVNDIEEAYLQNEYDRTSIIVDKTDNSNLNNYSDPDTTKNTENNESNNSKIREYRNKLRSIIPSKRKIEQEYKYTLKTFNEFIEMNKINPNSVHPDMVKKYYTKVLNLKDEYIRLKKVSNELVHSIIEETQLDEFKKLNLSETTILQQ